MWEGLEGGWVGARHEGASRKEAARGPHTLCSVLCLHLPNMGSERCKGAVPRVVATAPGYRPVVGQRLRARLWVALLLAGREDGKTEHGNTTGRRALAGFLWQGSLRRVTDQGESRTLRIKRVSQPPVSAAASRLCNS